MSRGIALIAALAITTRLVGQDAPACVGTHAAPSLLTVTESDRNGHRFDVCGLGPTPVDIESTILITPNLTALLGPLHVSSPETQALVDQTNTATALLRPFVDSVGYYMLAFIHAASNGDSIGKRSALRAHGRLVGAVMDYLKHVEPERLEAAAARGDFAAIGAVLTARLDSLDGALAAATRNALDAKHTYVVQLYAIHRGAGATATQVHLPGYDNLPEGDPHPINRLSFQPDDQAALQQQVSATQALASLINDARTNTNAVVDSLRKLVAGLSSSVQTITALVDSLPSRATVDSAAATLTTAELRPLADQMRALDPALAAIATARDIRAQLLAAAQPSTSPLTSLETLLGGLSKLEAFVEDKDKGLAAVTSTANALAELATTATTLRSTSPALVALRNGPLKRWAELATRFSTEFAAVKTAFAPLIQLATQTANLLGGAGNAQSQSGALKLQLEAVQAGQAAPTSLKLNDVQRRDGDDITITYKVLDKDLTTTYATEERTLRVRTFGAYRNWSAALAFVRSDPSTGFPAGASASYLLHYRIRPNPHTGEYSGRASFWNFLNPGIGLSSVVVSGKSNVEVGLGPTASLFSDIVQVGGGYNLAEQRWYFLLSTPLIDIVQRIGGP
jgi:hypothetical protein